jgi:hypothetical protein
MNQDYAISACSSGLCRRNLRKPMILKNDARGGGGGSKSVVIREIRVCLLLGSFEKQVPPLGLKSPVGMTAREQTTKGETSLMAVLVRNCILLDSERSNGRLPLYVTSLETTGEACSIR